MDLAHRAVHNGVALCFKEAERLLNSTESVMGVANLQRLALYLFFSPFGFFFILAEGAKT